jgi:ABC-type cobalamin/Fe3+-siderophores transport system ATPase subunit
MSTPNPWDEHFAFRNGIKHEPILGGRFWKIDFHFHTPASGHDYKGSNVTYETLAQRLRDEQIDAVFVTDHNEWSGIAQLQKACKQLGGHTIVFPGVELTLTTKAICLLQEGKKVSVVKFHCLALLPPEDGFEDKIKSLVTADHSDTDILKTKPVDRILKEPLEVVSRKVRESWNGIFIPAHLNQGKDISKSRSIDDLYEDSMTVDLLREYFDAVEIRKASSDFLFNGKYVTSGGVAVPQMSCVLGSDSHEPETIGREATWVQCEHLRFEEIREALKHRSRIKFAAPSATYSRLLSMNVEGAFLGKQAFDFSACMTSFIGSKGSGKTGVLELVRFALGYQSNVDGGYLTHLLGPGGKVSVATEVTGGDRFVFIRNASDTQPNVYSSDGSKLERSAVIPTLLNVEIRGWGETTRLAVDEDEQRRLIDNFDDSEVTRQATKAIARAKDEARDALKSLRAQVERFRERRAEIQELALKEAALAKLDAGDFEAKQKQKEQRESDSLLLAQLLAALQSAKHAVKVNLLTPDVDAMFESFDKRRRQAGGDDVVAEANELSASVSALRGASEELRAQAVHQVELLEGKLASIVEKTRTRNAPLDETYQQEFSGLTVQEQVVLAERNRVVTQISQLDALRGQQLTAWSQLEETLKKVATAFQSIAEALATRSERRAAIVSEINGVLAANNVGTRLEFVNMQRATGILPSGATAPDAFSVRAASYTGIDEDSVTSRIFLTETSIEEEVNLIVDDGVAVKFEIYPGAWKSAAELSAGQKSTAMLPLLLMAAKGPIILDQPEDNLDNKYIGGSVVSMLSDRKNRNQVIVATHSASIVVMADSDLIVEMADDTNHGKVVTRGFLAGPDSTIAKSVLNILDGGREALLTRFKKYGKLVAD